MVPDKSDEERSFPQATIYKLIQSSLKKSYTVSGEAKPILKEACQLFLNMVILEANRICGKEKKKIIANKHVYKALEKYQFEEYIRPCEEAANDYDDYSRHKPSKQDKFKESGKTLEELHADQMRLFDQAKREQNVAFEIPTDDETVNSQRDENNK